MTAIAVWYSQEGSDLSRLWAAADSRVSRDGNPIFESCAKLLPLTVMCQAQPFSEPHSIHSYGYCFAGSSLMGQNSYLSVSPLLTGLMAEDGYTPSLADVARFVFAHLRSSYEEYKISVGSAANFEALLFGWCPAKDKLLVCHYHPQKNTEGIYTLVAEMKALQENGDFVYIGEKKSEVKARIEASFMGPPQPGRPLTRGPRHVIDDLIEEQIFPSIGDDLQIGIATMAGYMPFAVMRPIEVGKPAASMKYLGREVTGAFAHVGRALVCSSAMA